MVNHTPNTKTISLDQYGIKNANVKYQLQYILENLLDDPLRIVL